jgi:RNA-directed DNA polymerase
LAFIDYVRERADPRPLRDKQDEPTQFFEMLRRFNLFKFFLGNPKPTILTEGPSDIVYLKAAARKTTQGIDQIYSGGAFHVGFFKFDSRASQVLGITGGCGTLKRFLYLNKHHSKDFSLAGERQPVILVVDNDRAGRDVVNMINGIYKTAIAMDDSKLWFRVTEHLYLVKTPLAANQNSSCIEDALGPCLRRGTEEDVIIVVEVGRPFVVAQDRLAVPVAGEG